MVELIRNERNTKGECSCCCRSVPPMFDSTLLVGVKEGLRIAISDQFILVASMAGCWCSVVEQMLARRSSLCTTAILVALEWCESKFNVIPLFADLVYSIRSIVPFWLIFILVSNIGRQVDFKSDGVMFRVHVLEHAVRFTYCLHHCANVVHIPNLDLWF